MHGCSGASSAAFKTQHERSGPYAGLQLELEYGIKLSCHLSERGCQRCLCELPYVCLFDQRVETRGWTRVY